MFYRQKPKLQRNISTLSKSSVSRRDKHFHICFESSTSRNQSYNEIYQLYQNRAFHGEINTFTHVLIYFRISAKSALIIHVLFCKYLLNTIFSHYIHANCARNYLFRVTFKSLKISKNLVLTSIFAKFFPTIYRVFSIF